MTLPPLFQDSLTYYLLCLLILLGGQLIYATVGFGAGMFAVTLLVLLLGEIPGVVMTMLLLTWITEVLVLSREWRYAWGRLLLVIVPPTVVGLWFGTNALASGDGDALKRMLGAVVAAAGFWFLYSDFRESRRNARQGTSTANTQPQLTVAKAAASLPAGLAAGFLGALFGTGGPPVIVLFKSFGLDKRAFRATLLALFMTKSVTRASFGIYKGLLTLDHVWAAFYLIPGSVLGTIIGAKIYHRLSERHFGRAVSILIVILGLTLLATGGRK